MKVKEIMTTQVITCTPEETIKNVAQIIKKERISGIPIIDDNKIVGIITEADILKLLKTPTIGGNLWLPSPFEIIEVPLRELIGWEELKHSLENTGNKPVKSIMTTTVHTISPEDSIETASEKMVQHHVNRLPVVQDEKLVGIIARADIIKALSSETE